MLTWDAVREAGSSPSDWLARLALQCIVSDVEYQFDVSDNAILRTCQVVRCESCQFWHMLVVSQLFRKV